MPSRLESIEQYRENNKRYFKYIKYPNIPLSVNDIYAVTVEGDRLDLIANQFYNDVDLWWIITTANPDIIRRDSLNLKPGLQIRIPDPNRVSNILRSFEQLNK